MSSLGYTEGEGRGYDRLEALLCSFYSRSEVLKQSLLLIAQNKSTWVKCVPSVGDAPSSVHLGRH